MAVKRDVKMPIESVIAKPLIGPVPNDTHSLYKRSGGNNGCKERR